MASLPKVPFTDIEDFRVAVDAPVSTDLMTDIVIDLNNLRSILRDGAAAVEDIVANNVNILGALDVTGNSQMDGDLQVDGTFSTGFFFGTQQFIWTLGL